MMGNSTSAGSACLPANQDAAGHLRELSLIWWAYGAKAVFYGQRPSSATDWGCSTDFRYAAISGSKNL